MAIRQEKVSEWKGKLESLEPTACKFAHHGEDGDFPLCPTRVQNTRHGCAHAMAYLLREVVMDMNREGVFGNAEYEELMYQISKGQHALVYEQDFVIALEPIDRHKEEQIYREQETVISGRVQITNQLLQRLQSDFMNGSSVAV
jgi:hypothetical protein